MDFKFLQPKTPEERLSDYKEQNSPPDETAVMYQDNDLVRRTRQGDVGAFEEIFARHSKRVYNIALQMLGDESDAADATQEVFVHAYERIGSLKSDAAFVTWLKMIAVNRCRDILRKRGRVKIDSLDAPVKCDDGSSINTEVADWSNNPEVSFGKKELKEVVRKAISSLSPDYREVVTLFYVDGADIAGISKTLNCPVGTIKCRLSRARAELKRKLECYVR